MCLQRLSTTGIWWDTEVAFGETEIEVIGSWLKATEPLLFDGDITAVVARIRGFAAQQSEVLDILEREARYFEKHTERMPYKVFREKWGVGQILE